MLEILEDFITKLKREIRDFEWAALPDSEKERIEKSNEDWKRKHGSLKE